MIKRASIWTLLIAVSAFRAALPVHAELIPNTRVVDWTPGVTVGVPGGIPTNRNNLIDVTRSPYNADKTGSSDAAKAIQAAINAANPEDVVYLPAGTYRIDSSLYIGTKRITLRGTGASTIIDCRVPGTGIYMGSGSDYDWSQPATGNIVTGGLAKGSTTLTIADTSAFSVGQLVQFSVENDSNLPVISVHGYPMMRRQMTRITAKTATTLSIFPGLYSDYGRGSLSAKVNVARQVGNNIGIEDLVIEAGGRTQYVIFAEQCYASWVKNVHSKNAKNVHIYFANSVNCEIRHCNLDVVGNGGSPNGSGLQWNTCSAGLVEDNIIHKAFPLIEVNYGSCGNVFAYNFTLDSRPGVGIDTNHGPHNAFNLYEGNIGPNIQADGYYGSVSDDTVFRNWLTGQQVDGSPGHAVILNRMARNYSIVGNLLGTTSSDAAYSFGNPNLGNGWYDGTAQPSAGRDWKDRNIYGTLTTRTNDVGGIVTLTSGVGQIPPDRYPFSVVWDGAGRYNFTALSVSGQTIAFGDGPSAGSFGAPLAPTGTPIRIWPGALGFQELDLDVEATTLRKANWNSVAKAVPASEGLAAGETLPNSLYRKSKPAFFGDLPWPAFDPARPNLKFEAIPAGYRYVHGVDPQGSAPTPPPAEHEQKPINVRVRN